MSDPVQERLDQLLTRYESGNITRRTLLGALAGLLAVPPPASATEPAIGTVKQLNHVTLYVQDVAKSVAFYQGLFGMPVLTPQPPGMNLRVGAAFLGIYPATGQPSGINHVCLGLDNFDADSVLNKLNNRGIKANIRLRDNTKELYLTDPDNIRVQLQDVSYKGGAGPLGNRDPK